MKKKTIKETRLLLHGSREQFIANNWLEVQDALSDFLAGKQTQKEYSKFIDILIKEMVKVWDKGYKGGQVSMKD